MVWPPPQTPGDPRERHGRRCPPAALLGLALIALLLRHDFRWHEDRGHAFENGCRLRGLDGVPDCRSWRSFLARRDRENPIRVADRLRAWYRLPSCGTYARVALHSGTTGAIVCHHLALLARLPDWFVEWPRGQDDPGAFGRFAGRLRPVTRVTDVGKQVETLRESVRGVPLDPGQIRPAAN